MPHVLGSSCPQPLPGVGLPPVCFQRGMALPICLGITAAAPCRRGSQGRTAQAVPRNGGALPAAFKQPRIHRLRRGRTTGTAQTGETKGAPLAVPSADAPTAPAPVDTQGSSPATSTAAMINVAVGAGILSMPYAFSLVGWELGLGLTGL